MYHLTIKPIWLRQLWLKFTSFITVLFTVYFCKVGLLTLPSTGWHRTYCLCFVSDVTPPFVLHYKPYFSFHCKLVWTTVHALTFFQLFILFYYDFIYSVHSLNCIFWHFDILLLKHSFLFSMNIPFFILLRTYKMCFMCKLYINLPCLTVS